VDEDMHEIFMTRQWDLITNQKPKIISTKGSSRIRKSKNGRGGGRKSSRSQFLSKTRQNQSSVLNPSSTLPTLPSPSSNHPHLDSRLMWSKSTNYLHTGELNQSMCKMVRLRRKLERKTQFYGSSF